MVRGVILLALVLGGCAANKPVWTRAGATSQDFEKDKLACEYEAKKHAGGINTMDPIGSAVESGLRMNELGQMCMRTKGWAQVQQ